MHAILATHRGGKYFVFMMFLSLASLGILRAYIVHEPLQSVAIVPKKNKNVTKKSVAPIVVKPLMQIEDKTLQKKIPAPLPKAINLSLPLKSGVIR